MELRKKFFKTQEFHAGVRRRESVRPQFLVRVRATRPARHAACARSVTIWRNRRDRRRAIVAALPTTDSLSTSSRPSITCGLEYQMTFANVRRGHDGYEKSPRVGRPPELHHCCRIPPRQRIQTRHGPSRSELALRDGGDDRELLSMVRPTVSRCLPSQIPLDLVLRRDCDPPKNDAMRSRYSEAPFLMMLVRVAARSPAELRRAVRPSLQCRTGARCPRSVGIIP